MFAMTAIIGLIIVAYYSSIKCDPLANKDIANPNMVRQLLGLLLALISWSPLFIELAIGVYATSR